MTLFAELADRSWFPPDNSSVCWARKPEAGRALPGTRTSGPDSGPWFPQCGQICSNLSSKYGFSNASRSALKDPQVLSAANDQRSELVGLGERRSGNFAPVQQRRVQLAGMGAICDRCLPQPWGSAEGGSRWEIVVGQHEKFRGATSGLHRPVDIEINRSYRVSTPPLARGHSRGRLPIWFS
jgi:hypothetical protein